MRASPFVVVGMLLLEIPWLLANLGDSEANDSIIYGSPLALGFGALLGWIANLTARCFARVAPQNE